MLLDQIQFDPCVAVHVVILFLMPLEVDVKSLELISAIAADEAIVVRVVINCVLVVSHLTERVDDQT